MALCRLRGKLAVPRDALFDLAVNRALSYAQRLEVALDEADSLRSSLEIWYLKTRFAYRIPLDEIVAVLQTSPGEAYVWQGGRTGGWQTGRNPRP